MKFDPEKFHRRSIRLREYDYSSAGAYFVTICAKEKVHLFGEIVDGVMSLNEVGVIVDAGLHEIGNVVPNVSIDIAVVMPNHMHAVVVFEDSVGAIHESPHAMGMQERRKMGLSKIIGRYKMQTSKSINALRGITGEPVWQRNYYEHVIRDNAEMNRIRAYIVDNPVNWDTDEMNVVDL